MQCTFSDSNTTKITGKLQKSAFVGLIRDETVNFTVRKKLIIYFVAIEKGIKHTHFNSTAETSRVGKMQDYNEQSYGLWIGVAVMMGCKTGMAKQFIPL